MIRSLLLLIIGIINTVLFSIYFIYFADLYLAANAHLILFLAYYFINLSNKMKARRLNLIIPFFIPGFGMLMTTTVDLALRFIIEKKDTLAEYEEYVNYLNDLVVSNTADLDRDTDTLSIYDNLKYSTNLKKKEVLTDLIEEDSKYRVDVLRKALLDEDSEVVHYAASSISHIEQEFEESIMKIRKEYMLGNDALSLSQLVHTYKNYLISGLLEGELKTITTKEYYELLVELYEFNPSKEILLELVETTMSLGKYDLAVERIRQGEETFPEEHKFITLEMKLCFLEKNFMKLKELAIRLKSGNYHIDDDEKNILEFWT